MTRKADQHRLEVLRHVQTNNKMTSEEIATEMGDLSGEQVRRIIHAAENDKIILEHRAIIDPRKLGLGNLYFITIVLKNKTPAARDSVIEQLLDYPHVQEVHRIEGEIDLQVKLRCATTDDKAAFDDFLRGNEHVERVTSLTVLVSCRETSAIDIDKLHVRGR